MNAIRPFCNKIRLVFVLALGLSGGVCYADSDRPAMPVSINALMVTLIDHSANYIWHYGYLSGERNLSDKEWRIVEYYAVQLAASGPLITLGGTGKMDTTWSANSDWRRMSEEMTTSAMAALDAARSQDHPGLLEAGDRLVESCVACHNSFRPSVPTEGILHDPQYDHLYHLLYPQESGHQ